MKALEGIDEKYHAETLRYLADLAKNAGPVDYIVMYNTPFGVVRVDDSLPAEALLGIVADAVRDRDRTLKVYAPDRDSGL